MIKLLLLLAAMWILSAVSALAGQPVSDFVIPAQQSDCEIRANEFKQQHPNISPEDFLFKFGFFWFGKSLKPSPSTSYRDPGSGTTFYVESDGRHLAAIDREGRLLWVRNPFVDSDLCPYRSAHPFIHWIGAPGGGFGFDSFAPTPDDIVNPRIVRELNDEINRGAKFDRPRSDDRFIGLTFDSSQRGHVNIRNGDFYFGTQN